jgi:hypothetical protein
MPAGGGMGMRTVWISLRAVNYTEQAFKNTAKSLDGLTDAQKKMRDSYLKTIDTAKLQIQTGTLYLAMLSMVGTKLGALLQTTQVGAQYMTQFNQTVKELKTSFADTLFLALKPLLDVLMAFMNVLKDNSALRTVIVYGGLLAIVIAGLYSAYIIFNNILLTNRTMQALNILMSGKSATANIAHATTVHGVKIAYWQLGAAMGAAFAAFTITFSLLQGASPIISGVIAAVFALAAAFWYLYVAESAATLGVAAVLGGIAAGAAVATAVGVQNSMKSHAVGTRMVAETGPAFLHRGEIVYNPSVNRPAGVEQEVMGARSSRGSPSSVTVNFNGDIHTKASVEEIDDRFGRKIYRAVKGAS